MPFPCKTSVGDLTLLICEEFQFILLMLPLRNPHPWLTPASCLSLSFSRGSLVTKRSGSWSPRRPSMTAMCKCSFPPAEGRSCREILRRARPGFLLGSSPDWFPALPKPLPCFWAGRREVGDPCVLGADGGCGHLFGKAGLPPCDVTFRAHGPMCSRAALMRLRGR